MRNADVAVWGILLLAIIGFAAISAGAVALGLDRESFAHLLGNLVAWALAVGGVIYLGGWGTARQWWPVIVAALWLCFWQALSFWGVMHIGREGGLLTASTLQEIGEAAPWSTAGFKLLVAGGVLVAGVLFDPGARPLADL